MKKDPESMSKKELEKLIRDVEKKMKKGGSGTEFRGGSAAA